MKRHSQSQIERVPRSLEIQCPVCNARVGQECFKRWKGDDERHSYERPRNVYAETEICPVCKDEVPLDSLLSYNNIPNAFCQGCVDSGRV